MSKASEQFDHWIRTSFVEMNTSLEELYFAKDDPAEVIGVGDEVKQQLADEGNALIRPLVNEGNTDEGFDKAYDLLGNLGLFLAALRRHELTNPEREQSSPFKEASALGLHLGSSLGVAPRFATAHLATRNKAVNGVQKSFTSLKDEFIFIDHNTMGILCYMRAADALMRISLLGISNQASYYLLQTAKSALEDVAHHNDILFADLDIQRFFYCVRPYYKPYRVGRAEYRGANAGDFAGINQIDLLLGLCRGNDPYYSQMMVDKMPYMLPEDQQSLMNCLRRKSLLDELLDVAENCHGESWFQRNAQAFLDVCKAHGYTAEQHHNQLVSRFITSPSDQMEEKHLKQITASGPPLPVLLSTLEKLRDLRMAAPRGDIVTAHDKLNQLKAFCTR